jgi:oligosaccharide repeat unit polymerase
MTSPTAGAAPTPNELQPDVVNILLSLLALVGALLAVLTDATGPNQVRVLAVLSVSCAGFALWRCHRGLGRRFELGAFVFVLGLLFWFYVPALTTAWTEEQWHQEAALIYITNENGLWAFCAVNAFFFVFSLAYQFRLPRRWVQRISVTFRDGASVPPNLMFVLLILGFLICFAFYVVQSGGIGTAIGLALFSRSAVKPWSAQGNYGTGLTPFHYFMASGMTLVAALSVWAVLLHPVSRLKKAILLFVALGCVAWTAVDSGTRSSLLMALMPPLLLFYRDTLIRKGLVKHARFTLLGVTLLAIVVATSAQREYRASGTIEDPPSVTVEDNDFFTYTAYAMAIAEHEEPVRESVLYNILAGPVPRALWPSKPEIQTVLVFSWYVWGQDVTESGGNTLPSIVGQYFLAWRWLGVVEIALVLGLLFRFGDRFYAQSRARKEADSDMSNLAHMMYGLFIVYVFLSFRTMSFAQAFVPMMGFALVRAAPHLRRLAIRPKANPPKPDTSVEPQHRPTHSRTSSTRG